MENTKLTILSLSFLILFFACKTEDQVETENVIENESETQDKINPETITFEYSPDYEMRDCVLDFLDFKRDNEDSVDFYGVNLTATISYKGLEYNASKELIPEKELANMYLADLQLLRNSIYARHGYIFKTALYQEIFNERCMGTWYKPVYENVDDELTEIEKENIERILRYEKFAEEFYQSFTR
ncbi:MAG: YARHG domain-containing protein [Chitinophagales bacterium]